VSDNKRISKRVAVGFTAEQFEKISAAAAASGMTVSAYLRMLAIAAVNKQEGSVIASG
jgi:hypothetical protein